MRIVLATGIYPPEIGGPATYVKNLAERLCARGEEVRVVAYGERQKGQERQEGEEGWKVVRVPRTGGPIIRWVRYARALKLMGSDADIVYAFSSVSAGVPLWLSGLRHPRTMLRLGGDFLWERSTDRGGDLSLRDWYAASPFFRGAMNGLLKQFDHIVFSTAFQEELYERFYAQLPLRSVIENALPAGVPILHARHDPFRLLFLGRFVPFKNLGSLLLALKECPGMTLTLAGGGPLEARLRHILSEQGIADRVTILPPQYGDRKRQLLLDHDLLVLPSYTELSPNTALESRAAGLPVLLTEETGLSRSLTDGTLLRTLRSPRDIAKALLEAYEQYEPLALRASAPLPLRTWDTVTDEHLLLFQNLL